MVYRGKPSAACERCRTRKLKCDIRPGKCSPCVRAGAHCSGYRDATALRIVNESEGVMKKANKYGVIVSAMMSTIPQYVPQTLDAQAKDAFFVRYVTTTSKCWDFLRPFYHPVDSPAYLVSAIEAASLAYFWHQVYSDTALRIAAEKYVSALRLMNESLKRPDEVTKDTMVLASLLLDLFEKITGSEPQIEPAWTSHINGAMALARHRGFAASCPQSVRILARLSGHYVISCVASDTAVSSDLLAIRESIGRPQYLSKDPMWQMLDLCTEYANLRSQMHKGLLPTPDYFKALMQLDSRIKQMLLNLPTSWQGIKTVSENMSDHVFGLYYESHNSRHICHSINMLRGIRIIINESLIQYQLSLKRRSGAFTLVDAAQHEIATLCEEICSTVPQYLDCNGAARSRLLRTESPLDDGHLPDLSFVIRHGHQHLPNHHLDCYTLIFPLYIAANTRNVSLIKTWIIRQLYHMSDHFCMRNANLVAQILERGEHVSPWKIYAILGSYAFPA